MNNINVYKSIKDSLKELNNYLQADVEVSKATVADYMRPPADGFKIIIKITNSAPTEDNWPLIVFTGVSLTVKFLKGPKHAVQGLRSNGRIRIDTEHIEIGRAHV